MIDGSTEVKRTLEDEAHHGAIIANRLRYGLALILIIGIQFFQNKMYSNAMFAAVYFIVVTVLHSVVLEKGTGFQKNVFSYIVLFSDFGFVFIMLIVMTFVNGNGNFAFAIKDDTYWFLLFPLALQLLQLKIRLVATAVVSMVLVHYIFVGLVLASNPVFTDNWYNNIFQGGLILEDIFVVRAMIVFGLGVILIYNIYRSVLIVHKLGKANQNRVELSRYFSPSVTDYILKQNELADHERKMEVTLLFADIRGFTQMAEAMTPEDVVVFLNDYLSEMVDIIFANGGTLDKFMGDGIMAYFGAPVVSENHPSAAVTCAKEMTIALERMNTKRAVKNESAISIGIGIHTGEVIIGNIGSKYRREFTVIGDSVNLASRIESLTKELSSTILVSEATKKKAKVMFEFISLGEVNIRGKTGKVLLYSV